MKPIISVIVPIYNAQTYLNRSLKSIVSQTYKELEIILIDDGSSDKSPEICDEWAKRDFRIKVIHQNNKGCAEARNAGLQAAVGDYIMFVDCDDWLSLDAVEVLYERIQDDNSDIAIGQNVFSYENGDEKILYSEWMYDTVFDRKTALKKLGNTQHIPYFIWGKLYRSSIVKDLKVPKFLCAEDLYFLLLALDMCNTVSIVSKVVYHYFQHSGSLMHNRNDRVIFDDVTVLMLISKWFLNEKMQEQAGYFYTMGVFRATDAKCKKAIKQLIRKQFSYKQRKELLEKSLRMYWRYLSLYMPFITVIVDAIKKIKNK